MLERTICFCGQIRCKFACSSGNESFIDLRSLSFLPHIAAEYFHFGEFHTIFVPFFSFSSVPALMAAPVWTASTPSRVYAHQASPGTTVSMTSTSVTPSRV